MPPSSAFERVAAVGRGRFYATFGVPVTYRRGGSSKSLVAIPSGQSLRQLRGDEPAIGADERDWVMRRADLAFEATPVTPQAGDTIEHGAEVWRVLSGTGPIEATDVDPEGVEIRVRTVLVSAR